MWYLVFDEQTSLSISWRDNYMVFNDYYEAEEYAKEKGIKGIITDDLTPFINSIIKESKYV